jgi:sugar phosphate isomerase/epimerase
MSTRRNFFKMSLAAASTVMFSPVLKGKSVLSAEQLPGPDTGSMKLSILSYSFHGLRRLGMMDIFHFMESCKYRYHLNTADLWNGHLESTDDDYILKVKEALDERELFIPNLACDGCHVLDQDQERTKITNQNAWAHLRAAKTLGIGFVRIDSGPQLREGLTDWTNQEFDFIVKRYREYAQFAYDNGFKAGAENHMGPSLYWPAMKRLIAAVDHPGFAICNHINGWRGTQEEKDLADIESAPYTQHTHIPWNICEGPLVEKMNILRHASYPGYYSVEHHSARNEYANVAIQLSKVRAVLHSWALGREGSA